MEIVAHALLSIFAAGMWVVVGGFFWWGVHEYRRGGGKCGSRGMALWTAGVALTTLVVSGWWAVGR